ncbi:hypothetical protein [Oricola sp.]|uniref:hypothetical protein n=1 Tax=Oricola sp. TaxID=1979950 RepID=UPI0035193E67
MDVVRQGAFDHFRQQRPGAPASFDQFIDACALFVDVDFVVVHVSRLLQPFIYAHPIKAR